MRYKGCRNAIDGLKIAINPVTTENRMKFIKDTVPIKCNYITMT